MDDSQRRRRVIAVAVGALLLLGLLGGCGVWLTRDEPAPQTGALRVVQGRGEAAGSNETGLAPFAATGEVVGLAPGKMQALKVTITNPDEVAYRIQQLTATPEDANSDCVGPTNLVVSSYEATKPGAATYVVPRKSSITIPLTVMMLNTASSQDACKDVTFPLAFDGVAVQGQGKGNS